ncbi:MAG: 2-amino-4-hydroxy-6-hydroxymethyldihydropteridine diphosphokinase [Candidatus Thiodiazotropha sp. (ex Monitilora ramsayi)]|nr:2-amino-4-hydroxy-6-hydroxymethyldihydropteridine diphosphokinase [Candidatus Thiodiazotropha sp. (ex Monitilora ramsayi)]
MSEFERVTAYVGLGSNLEEPLSQVKEAETELAYLPDTDLTAVSSLYWTRPVGPADQPDFINAVAKISTQLPAEKLLDELQLLEQRHGRIREGVRWGPRTLDLDLLLYGDMTIDSPRLKVPHPYLSGRAFVLYPLSEIAADDLMIPGAGMLGDLLKEVSDDGIERID